MKEALRSRKVRLFISAFGSAAALLVTFGLGITVGYHRAIFASQFGANYYRNFYGTASSGPMMDMTGMMPGPRHGIVGTVLDVQSSTIIAEDSDGDEQSILILPTTLLREANITVPMTSIVIGDHITVIGTPDANGQIEASFVRVLPVSPTGK